MRQVLKLTSAPIISLITIMLGISYLNTYTSVKMTLDGFNSFVTGILYASYYGGIMTGAIYLEKIIHSKGHIRSFAIFAATAATAIICLSFTNPPFFWIFFRFFIGVAVAGLFIVIESWLLLLSSTKDRGAILSLYMVTIYSAQCLGQFGISLVPMNSILPLNLSLIFCTASIIPVCIMKAQAPTLSEAEYINVFYILKKIPLGFFGNLTAGLILGAFYALGPVYGKNMGYSLFHISIIMSVTILGGMVLQWPIGKLSDIFQRRKIIITICFLIFFISSTLAIFKTIPFHYLLTLLFLFGGFIFTLYPISITYCCDFFSSAGITSVTAAALLIYGFGCIIGPILSPLFLMILGPNGLFIYIAILALTLAILAIWRQHKLPMQPENTKESYKVNPGTTGKFSDNP